MAEYQRIVLKRLPLISASGRVVSKRRKRAEMAIACCEAVVKDGEVNQKSMSCSISPCWTGLEGVSVLVLVEKLDELPRNVPEDAILASVGHGSSKVSSTGLPVNISGEDSTMFISLKWERYHINKSKRGRGTFGAATERASGSEASNAAARSFGRAFDIKSSASLKKRNRRPASLISGFRSK